MEKLIVLVGGSYMGTQYALTPKYQQKICPKAMQGLQVLALPVTALNEYLDSIYTDNPLIELDSDFTSSKNSQDDPKEIIETDFSKYRSCRKENNIMNDLADGEGFLGNVHESETLHGALHLQLLLSDLSSLEMKIGEEIIGNISSNGYFVGELHEISFHTQQNVEIVQKVLEKIQTFSPRGIGANSIEECLILQVGSKIPNKEKVIEIIKNDLEDLAQRKMTKLSKKYRLNKEQLQETLDYIRTLNPRPGNEFQECVQTSYIIPDVVVKREEGEFLIYINNETQHAININQNYLHMLQNRKINNTDKEYIRGKRNEARTLVKCLEMRRETLRNLTVFILNTQQHFFEMGTQSLKPMMMQQAADAMGVNVSTVSRAVQGKYIETPWGVFPLKYFFTSPCNKQSESQISSTQIKEMIQIIIEEENEVNPLKDADIMEKLKDKGIRISRRTVSKYRLALGIAGQNQRKRFF